MAKLDTVVSALFRSEAPASKPTSLSLVDRVWRLIDEEHIDAALSELGGCDATDPLVRAALAEIHFSRSDYGAVADLLDGIDGRSLSTTELQHLIWSLCELGRFDLAQELALIQAETTTSAAHLFRTGVLERFGSRFAPLRTGNNGMTQ